MALDPFFLWIESSALSVWLRESPSIWAFPFVLILHTVGLAFLVGTDVAICGRTLGLAGQVPLPSLRRYLAVMWLGLWTNAGSGLLLLIAYPTKALTNPLFYAKLALIAVALSLGASIRRALREDGSGTTRWLKPRAAAALACWAASIVAGRLLAYTHTRLTVIDEIP
jgi:hypothetical protein